MSECKECERLREVLKEINSEVNRRAFGGGGTGLLSNLPHVLDNILKDAWVLIQPPQQDSKPTPEKPCETCGEAQEQVDRYRRALKWAKETLEAQKPPVMSAEYSVIVGILHVLNLESKCVLCQGRGEVPEESGAWVPCPNGCTPAEEED